MEDRPSRHLKRDAIKQTVERAIPQLEIDVTKELTDEEMAVLAQQTADMLAAKKLAQEVGRAGLRERLKRTIASTDRILEGKKES